VEDVLNEKVDEYQRGIAVTSVKGDFVMRSRFGLVFLLFIVLTCAIGEMQAQQPSTTTPLGPEGGGPFTILRPDPTTINGFIAATNFGSIYYTFDGGFRWQDRSGNVSESDITNAAMTHRGTLLVGTNDSGVKRSENGGTRQSEDSSGGLSGAGLNIHHIEPAGFNRDFLGTGSGLFVSNDNGRNWNEIIVDPNNPDRPVIDVAALNTSVGLPPTVVALASGANGTGTEVFVSPTGETGSFSSLNTGLNGVITDVTLNFNFLSNSTEAFAAGDNGVFKIIDLNPNSGQWTQVSFTPAIRVEANPTDPNIVVVIMANNTLLLSQNGGNTFNPISANSGLPNDGIQSIVFNPTFGSTPEALVGMNSSGIFGINNLATSPQVTPLNTGIQAYTVNNIVQMPLSDVLYQATVGQGVLKSMDGGRTWTAVNNGLTNRRILSFAIDPLSGVLYAGTADGVFKSADMGQNWTLINDGLTDPFIRALVIDQTNPNVLYAGTLGGVFKSTNGGQNWTLINNGLTDPFIRALVIDQTNPNVLYAGTDSNGVFKSADMGQTWTPINNGLTNYLIEALVIDPTNPNVLYAGTLGNGVFKSADMGQTWTPINDGLTGFFIRDLAIDPTNPNVLYAGTGVSSVFKSVDGGRNWISLIADLPSPVASIAVDPEDPNKLLVGTRGSGGFVVQQTGDPIIFPNLVVNADAPAQAQVGEQVTVNFAVTNTSPTTAFNVNLFVTLPDNVVFNGASPGGVFQGGGVRFSLGDVATDQLKNAFVNLTPTPAADGQTLETGATAIAIPDSRDIEESNNVAAAETFIGNEPPPPTPDLVVTATDTPDPANVSGNVTVTANVTNTGGATAKDVTVLFMLPPNVTFDSTASTPGSVEAGGMVLYSVGDIPAGASRPVSVVFRPPVTAAGQILTTTVNVASTPADDPNGNTAETETLVNEVQEPTPLPDLTFPSRVELKVTRNPGIFYGASVETKEIVRFTITVVNQGNADSPATKGSIDFFGVASGKKATFDVPPLLAGQQTTINLVVETDGLVGTIVNLKARVDNPDTVPESNEGNNVIRFERSSRDTQQLRNRSVTRETRQKQKNRPARPPTQRTGRRR
jgi:uncharacterized repeat protein (TIGR01451 family)